MSTNINHEAEVHQMPRAGTFLERFTDRIGRNVLASTVFGEPVERDGITVIPVAKTHWGFGGGAGGNPNDASAGDAVGGGGAAAVTPIGYIEIKDGQARFRPIYDPDMLVRLTIGAGIVAMLVLRGVRRLVRS